MTKDQDKDFERYMSKEAKERNPVYDPESSYFKSRKDSEKRYLDSAKDGADRVRKLQVIADETDPNVSTEKAKYKRGHVPTNEAMYGMKKGGKVKKMADGGIPKNTFLTKDALEKASSSMTAQRMRERDSINKDRKNAINKNKPGAPYYQPYDNAALGISTDNPDEAVARAKGQGKYVRDNSTAGSRFQEDEGVFAPTARMANMLMKGSSVKDATDMNNILGDKELMKGTRKAGQDAVTSYKGAMENQKEYGMKKGGKVKKMASGGKVSSASSRGDGCAQRGKTRGRMV